VLYVERRLAAKVLPELVRAVEDNELRELLDRHLVETREHVRAAERAFLAADAAPSAAYSDAFEGLIRQHEVVAARIVPSVLADVWHAVAAAHTEHYEIAGYRALFAYADEQGFDAGELAASLSDEGRALEALEAATKRLATRRP
jgi:ferritin-like metal-binding protein YciE